MFEVCPASLRKPWEDRAKKPKRPEVKPSIRENAIDFFRKILDDGLYLKDLADAATPVAEERQ